MQVNTHDIDPWAMGLRSLDESLAAFYKRHPIAKARVAPQPLPPAQIGALARELIESERKQGRTLNATEAVAHVMKQQRR